MGTSMINNHSILFQQFYKWWFDYFFTIFKYDGEIGTIPHSNIRYSPLSEDFVFNLISYVKFSHLINLAYAKYSTLTQFLNHLIKHIGWSSIIGFGKLVNIIPVILGTAKWEMFIFFHIVS